MSEQLSFLSVEAESRNKVRSYERTLAKLSRLSDELIRDLQAEPYTVHSPGDAAALVVAEMSCLQREELRVMLLNTRNRVTNIITLYRGSVNQSQVHVGEVFRPAILHCAPAIIVLHNHPSGDPTPSPDDVGVTRAIVQAGKLLDIDVLDHLVIAGGRFVSMKERGLGWS